MWSGGGGTPEQARLLAEYLRDRDPRTREQLILAHEPLVRFLAAKFVGRGEPFEDLIQVATIGLIAAIDRFEPARGVPFSAYAVPTIVGEIKRYFRDRTWNVKVPRGLHDLNQRVMQANKTLSRLLGRSPTIAEVAAEIGATEEATLQAMELSHVYAPLSLEVETGGSPEAEPLRLRDALAIVDRRLQQVDAYEDVREALACLDGRYKRVIDLRFYQELTQMEIAAQLGISQVHVSRLQQRALHRLRELLTLDDGSDAE